MAESPRIAITLISELINDVMKIAFMATWPNDQKLSHRRHVALPAQRN